MPAPTPLPLPLDGVLALGADKARLAKEVAKLDGEIGRLEKKLGNERFVANAPAEVVAEQRDHIAREALCDEVKVDLLEGDPDTSQGWEVSSLQGETVALCVVGKGS